MEAVVCISLEDQSIKFSKIHFEGWKLQHENECRDTNVWRSQIWRFFSDQPFPPPRPRPNSPMQRPPSLLRISNFFDYDPYPYPLPPTPTPTPYPLPPLPRATEQFRRKTWIYLSGAPIGWIFIQSYACLYSSRKEEGLLYLFAMNNAHHARKWSQKP